MKRDIKVETIERLEDVKVDQFKKIKNYEIDGKRFKVESEGTSASGLWTRLKADDGQVLIINKKDNTDLYNKYFL